MKMIRVIIKLLIIIALLYGALVTFLYVNQRSMMYHPSGSTYLPSSLAAFGAQTITLITEDHIRLSAWYIKGQADNPCLLYLHGNAGSLDTRTSRFIEIIESGFSLLAPSYRGFPESDGTPSEAGLFEDGKTAFNFLKEQCPNAPLLIYGESLGTGIATYLGATEKASAIILEAPYTATVDIAARQYPFIPVRQLMKDQFRSLERISAISEPLLILHGTKDHVIPYEHGVTLYEAANTPKQLESFEGADHDNLWQYQSWSQVLKTLKNWGIIASPPKNDADF